MDNDSETFKQWWAFTPRQFVTNQSRGIFFMKKQFIVIGIGRFGTSLIKTLIENNHEVLAVDKNLELVENMAGIATHAVQGDCTDEDVLAELGVDNFHHAIVAVGEEIQTSVLITLLLKEMGVPKVTAKAITEIHGKMLLKIGADQVVYPERDMGIRLGKQLSSENIIDYIQLSPDVNLVEMSVPPAMNDRTIEQLAIRKNFGCNIIAIKSGETVNSSPQAQDVIHTGDLLLLMGKYEDIKRIEDRYEEK